MLSLSLPHLSGLAQLYWGLNGFMGYPVGRRNANRFPWPDQSMIHTYNVSVCTSEL